jgi:tetratricopeptide (TPR) repeat protein
MVSLPSDKHTLAWFKLADLVMRKEKEKAVGMYRLLAHSLTDEAIIAQLEGDLLLAFQDNKAIACYERAALCYDRQGKLAEAAAVYEHLSTLQPDATTYITTLIKLYEKLAYEPKIARCLCHLIRVLLRKNLIQEAHRIIEDCTLPLSYQLPLHEQFVIASADQNFNTHELVVHHLLVVLDAYLKRDCQDGLTLFLTKLMALNSDLYHQAAVVLQKDQ